jgi:hypothetical protein
VCSRVHLVADLDILLLRPEAPGNIVTTGGDIDNRLKTLLDALRVPSVQEIPKDLMPREDEAPFHCLLEDDSLITSVRVQTDRLLEPTKGESEVVAIIHVTTKQLKTMMGTIGLA